MRRFLLWLLVLFILFYIFTDPAGAASVVEAAIDFLQDAGTALGAFFENLAS